MTSGLAHGGESGADELDRGSFDVDPWREVVGDGLDRSGHRTDDQPGDQHRGGSWNIEVLDEEVGGEGLRDVRIVGGERRHRRAGGRDEGEDVSSILDCREVHADQRLDRIRVRCGVREGTRDACCEEVHLAVVHGDQHVVGVGEVLVRERLGDARPLGQTLHGECADAPLDHERGRDVEQLFASLIASQTARARAPVDDGRGGFGHTSNGIVSYDDVSNETGSTSMTDRSTSDLSPILLAKRAVDVGLMTNDWPAYQTNLERLGVHYDHLLKVGGGVHQHRYAIGESVLKVNSHRAPLEPRSSTLTSIRFAAGPRFCSQSWTSPEGVGIESVPVGLDDIVDVEVRWRTSLPDEVVDFLCSALGGERSGRRVRVGSSWIIVDPSDEVVASDELDGAGARYLTVQVHDVVAEHRRIVDLGYASAREPVRLGDTACISFVRAPDGTWIEVSQRASLTGPLPDLD